jgi:hypothetical protein
MVDELRSWPQRVTGHAGRIFGNGKESCHLSTDGDEEGLHAFAKRLGMRRSWYQEHLIMYHYDLTPRRRELALKLGAVFVSAMDRAYLVDAHNERTAP